MYCKGDYQLGDGIAHEEKGRATIRQFINDESPQFVSLALDGWSQHHHGYIGSIASKC